MSLLSIDPIQMYKFTRKLQENLSKEIIDGMKAELKAIKPYYVSVGNSFEYDEQDGVVYSDDWSAAILNQGRLPGSYAPRDVILEWVKKYKNPSGSPKQQYMDMIRINKKLYEEGIDPHWYVDNVLFTMEQEHE